MTEHGILLETGTNEVEILELHVNGQSYGVNVLKVKQIVSYDPAKLTKIYGLHPAVKGMFMFREKSVPLIDLGKYFNETCTDGADLVAVICEFNQSVYGFVVQGLTKIYRISWDQIQSPSYLVHNIQAMITGIVPIEGREIMLMDLESIVGEVIGKRQTKIEVTFSNPEFRPEETRILVADDSALVRKQVDQILEDAGFTDVVICDNGQEAYDRIFGADQTGENKPYDILVTDIEMPLLDGLTLCRRVKETYPDMKVLVLSSLITDQMIAKCESVNADGHISKAEPHKLVPTIERVLTLVPA